MAKLIKGGTVVNAGGCQKADVLIENGVITKIEENISVSEGEAVNAEGCYVFPGFIDTHTHFDLDLGTMTTADDFKTGTRAAILGGTTTVLDFATQDRGGTLAQALDLWHKKARGASCNYGFHMAIASWNGHTSDEMEEMIREGVTSYKMYMVYEGLRMDDGSIYSAVKRARELGAVIGMHCENWDVLKKMIGEVRDSGVTGPRGHALSRPSPVEAEAVARYLRITELADAPAYVVHLSTKEGLFEATRARERGQKVYLETCPQYLVLTDKCYDEPDGAKFVMSPPLRKEEDNEALWEALKNRYIDTVGTDHCSFTMRQKALGKDDFVKIPNGGAGVQDRARLIYSYGVLKGRITLSDMAALLSENAARLFGMYPKRGVIKEGSAADVTVWDPSAKGVISFRTNAHNCDNSPFEGIEYSGAAKHVFLNGVHAVRDGRIAEEGKGTYVHRERCGFYR
jgi:dihydropyrimidinase